MLFICYFEIMPEKIAEVTKATKAHSGKANPPGIKLVFEGVSASHWGIAAFEAEREEDVFGYIRPFCSSNGKILVAPALRVDNGEYADRIPDSLM